jgi:hypothetical protein
MSIKETITCAVLEVCKGTHKPSLEEALAEWWKNPREDAGLRLSHDGFFIFSLAEIEGHKFQLPPSIHAKASTLLTLDRKMTCPYYLTQGKAPEIYIYGGKEASLFALYGDVEKFLRGIARQ